MTKAQLLLHSLFLLSSALGKVLGKFHVEIYGLFAVHIPETARPGKQRDSATQALESNWFNDLKPEPNLLHCSRV